MGFYGSETFHNISEFKKGDPLSSVGSWEKNGDVASFSFEVPKTKCSSGSTEAYIWASHVVDNGEAPGVFAAKKKNKRAHAIPIPMLAGGATFKWSVDVSGKVDVKQWQTILPKVNATQAGNVNFRAIYEQETGVDLDLINDTQRLK